MNTVLKKLPKIIQNMKMKFWVKAGFVWTPQPSPDPSLGKYNISNRKKSYISGLAARRRKTEPFLMLIVNNFPTIFPISFCLFTNPIIPNKINTHYLVNYEIK